MEITEASPLHRDALADLWRSTRLTTSYNDPYADLDFALAGPASTVLIGTVDGRVMASAMVGHDGHRGWLYYVAVDPSTQGAGYGAAMVEAAEAWLRDRGIWKVQLMVRETNIGVRAFYEHLGYEQSSVVVLSKKIAAGFPSAGADEKPAE
jgi:ribosomal protein S18 acetylase RimI-like enzyme